MFTTPSFTRRALSIGLALGAATLLTNVAAWSADTETKTETKTEIKSGKVSDKTEIEVEVEQEVPPGELRLPEPATTLAAPANCVYIEQTDAQGAACRALIKNACARPVNVNVEHHIEYIRFLQRDISSAGVNADHHGEPAAGFFASAGTFQGKMTAQIAPGKSRWFERFHKDANFHVDKCRVGFSAAW